MTNKNILNEVKRKPNNKVRLNVGRCEKPEEEMNFLQAFIILLLTVFAFAGLFMLVQRAMDINALNNCEEHRDCAEVIRDINGRE